MLRPICRFTAGGRLQIAAAHTHLSPAAPPFRRRGVMGGDDEGPLQGFKKGGDHKVQRTSRLRHPDQVLRFCAGHEFAAAAACAASASSNCMLMWALMLHLKTICSR
jgi:hypothetical protein